MGLTLTKVDDVKGSTPGYGTFGSWDQHVVSTPDGIFVAYSYIDDKFHHPNYWRLARSQDDGASFEVVYDGAEDGSLACAPALEADGYGNLYVIASSDQYDIPAPSAPTLFYRFSAGDYANPDVVSLPIGAPGKFSTVFDPARELIHVLQWAWSRQGVPHPDFYSLTTRGFVARSVNLFRAREAHPHAAPEYPCLALSPAGSIIAAWATMDDVLWQNGQGRQNYYDAHFVASRDGGVTWQGLGVGALALPIVGDDTGPAVTISDPAAMADTEPWGTAGYHGNWNIVHSVAFNRAALHCFYGGPLPSAHVPYVRFADDGSVAARRAPFFKTDDGFQFSDSGGAFSQDATGSGRLRFVGRYWHAGVAYIGVAASDDGGVSWQLVEPGAAFAGAVRYINASRLLPADGQLIGSFTGDPAGRMDGTGAAAVYFFRADAER